MNQKQKTEQVMRDLTNMAEEHGFQVVTTDPWDTLLQELLTGRSTVGATDWKAHEISITGLLADNPSFRVQVLAHEVGHLMLGHGDLVTGFATGDMVQNESEADRWAVNYLTAEGLPTDKIEQHDRDAHDPDNPSGEFYQQQSEYLQQQFGDDQ